MLNTNRKHVFGQGKNELKPGIVADCGGLFRSTAEVTPTYYTHEGNGGDRFE